MIPGFWGKYGIVPRLHMIAIQPWSASISGTSPVIERVGILVANSECFQGNRMLGNQAGLVEACRLTAIVRQYTFPLDHNGSSLGGNPMA